MYFDKESGRTAITRNKLSVPAKYLSDHGLLKGRILDFGCGKGSDVRILHEMLLDITGYDPNHRPIPLEGKYNTVMCNYVLNVLPENKVKEVFDKIKELLVPGGKAYITVRRDIVKEGKTSKDTLQYNVELNIPILYEKKKGFCIYFYQG